jgi:predicted nuclease with TOPRIM domain
MRFEKDSAVQQAVQRSVDEIQQLKETAGDLRGKLETQKMDFEALLQEQEKDNVNDKIHLQATIEKLRSELEKENV